MASDDKGLLLAHAAGQATHKRSVTNLHALTVVMVHNSVAYGYSSRHAQALAQRLAGALPRCG